MFPLDPAVRRTRARKSAVAQKHGPRDMQPPQQRKAEPVPTRWQICDARGLAGSLPHGATGDG
ncbi:MAG TPA: hypothetical protein VJ255_21320, partial [Candidatus Acidoferrum sp.]|nr:hypothetical protein [Candidatus Acidoferrum sp.]